jgi:leucyl-tRNA synthetase
MPGGRKLILLDALYGCTNEKSLQQRSLRYWEIDLYIGGNEHATGHLLYLFGINS